MTDARPTMTHRQFMQRLRTDRWRHIATIDVAFGDKLVAALVRNGWIERRENELRLTPAGLEAVRAKPPQHSGKVPLPKPQVRPTDDE